jgi:hypothetical protein
VAGEREQDPRGLALTRWNAELALTDDQAVVEAPDLVAHVVAA